MKLPVAASVILAVHHIKSAAADSTCVDYPNTVMTHMGLNFRRNVKGRCDQLHLKRTKTKHKKTDDRSETVRKGARCNSIKGAKQVCPLTCNACDECADPPSTVRFFVEGEGYTDCTWVSEDPESRCAGAKNICRLSCNVCSDTPTASPAPSSALSTISVSNGRQGHEFSCMKVDTTLKCWGRNVEGAVGRNAGWTAETPEVVNLKAGHYADKYFLGQNHACAILDNGELQCWGDNSAGQLGLGHTNNQHNPQTVDVGPGVCAVSVAPGYLHTCVILDNNSVKCWGKSDILGKSESTKNEDNKVPGSVVDLGDDSFNVAVIASGTYHTCALIARRTSVECWGYNYGSGPLGRGFTSADKVPFAPAEVQAINLGPGQKIEALRSGNYHNCVLLSGGVAKCWGLNNHAQATTDGIAQTNVDVAHHTTELSFGGLTVKDIAMGRDHTCVILSDGTMRCWGGNDAGQIGIGDFNSRSTPVEINPDPTPGGEGEAYAMSIWLGSFHTCAILSTGSMSCWGWNSYKQVGDNGSFNRPDPRAVAGL